MKEDKRLDRGSLKKKPNTVYSTSQPKANDQSKPQNNKLWGV